jgi:alpha-glucosidase
MPAAITFFNVFLLAWSGFFGSVRARLASLDEADRCEGYRTSNVIRGENALTADLTLVGRGCGIYGADLKELRVGVQWESGMFAVRAKLFDHIDMLQIPAFMS